MRTPPIRMITHTNRFGKTYYLKVGRTKAGKPKYFCSMKPAGANAESIPEGFEIHEDVNGGVFFRKLRLIVRGKARAEVEIREQASPRPVSIDGQRERFGHVERQRKQSIAGALPGGRVEVEVLKRGRVGIQPDREGQSLALHEGMQ